MLGCHKPVITPLPIRWVAHKGLLVKTDYSYKHDTIIDIRTLIYIYYNFYDFLDLPFFSTNFVVLLMLFLVV